MRFVVLGGAGDMGNEAVRTLASHSGTEEVMIADFNLKAATALAGKPGGPVRARRLDVLDHGALVEAIRGYHVALGFVGPFVHCRASSGAGGDRSQGPLREHSG